MPAAASGDGSLADGSCSCESLTADVGVDALCHAMEAFVSRKERSPLLDGLRWTLRRWRASAAISSKERGRRRGRRKGRHGARGVSGRCFLLRVVCVTLIHGMSRPLGARFHLAHGRSNAVLMSASDGLLTGARATYAQCSEALGLDGDLPTALGKLASSLGVPAPRRFIERGVDERAFRDTVPGMARDALASGSPANNPLVPSEADVAPALPRACLR